MDKSFKLEREKTDLTPYVLIDEEKGYMRFEGESYHENVIKYFREIIEWLKVFLLKDFDQFTFDCEFSYFSSATVKVLLNMLIDMDNSKNAGKVTVNWICDKRNNIVLECGEDFCEDLKNLNFNIIIKEAGG